MRLLALVALVSFLPAAAQIGIDLSLGPTVNWTEDVSAFTFDPDNPETILSQETVEVPVTVGLQGGLGVTVQGRALGVRIGGRFLNTTALYDGEQTLNRQALETSFVSLQLDLRYARGLGPASVYVFGGPEARFLLDLSGDIAGTQDLRDNADLLSVAANVGAGLRFDLFGTRIGPEIRYAFDVTGVEGNDVALDGGNTLRFDEAFDVDTLLFGLVFGGS